MPDWRLTRLNGEYCLTWDEPQPDGTAARRRYRLGTSDYREAQALAAARYAQFTRPVGKTITELWTAYRKAKESKAVIITMDYSWKRLEPYFGAIDGDAVTTEQCRLYAAERAREKAKGSSRTIGAGTIHTELGHLRTILTWARDERLIAHAPKIERPSKPAPKDVYLTRDDVRRMIEHAKVPHIALAIRVMIGTGARVAAVLELTWDRVDFDRDIIRLANPFDQVARKRRAVVPVNGQLREALIEAKRGSISNNVIEWAGEPVKSIKKGIAAAARSAGIEGATPHVFRHSAAVWMAEDGHDMAQISQFLGHSDSRITEKIYARYSPTYLRRLADSLEI